MSSSHSHSSRPATESEPQLTLRGHSAAITRIVHSPTRQLIYSASLDASIRVWSLPSSSHTTYAPYDPTSARGELIGHTDAVWDLALVRDESTLISGGAEGAIKIWDVGIPGGGALRLSWGYHGLEREASEREEPGATSVEPIRTDLKKVAVSYQNAVVKIFEIETGKEVSRLSTDTTYGWSFLGTPAQLMLTRSHRWYTSDPDQSDHLTSDDANACYCPRGQIHPHVQHFNRQVHLSLDEFTC